ncbi:MAG: BMP family ABC transporter substrate-binding protein [Candidatus Sericytochromatia bacterium]|nr:BMP family ABC transporter substrate-binding protein [Candidatus Sericytochromatia bacterium]
MNQLLYRFLPLALAAAVGLVACKGAGDDTGALRVGLVTDVGGLNDQGFNSLAYKGLRKVKKDLGAKTSVIESQKASDYEKNLAQFAGEKYDLVISVGFMMGDATRKVAERFPDARFAIVDFRYDKVLPNVAGYTFAEEQAGFLAGALAALTTKTGKVGFVGGMDVPVIHRFKVGYEEGVKLAAPQVKILSGYTGNFTDSAKGAEVATSQFQNGADIIFQAAGASGIGVIDAAKQQKKLAIGVDADQSGIAPDHVLSSALKKVDLAVVKAVESVMDKTFKGGNTKLTLADDAVGLAPFGKLDAQVSSETRKTLESLRGKLAKGEIVVKLSKADQN